MFVWFSVMTGGTNYGNTLFQLGLWGSDGHASFNDSTAAQARSASCAYHDIEGELFVIGFRIHHLLFGEVCSAELVLGYRCQ